MWSLGPVRTWPKKVALILQRSLREIAAAPFRWLSIGLIAALGMSIYAGMYSAIDSLFATRDAYYEEGALADLEIRFIAEDSINVPAFDDLVGLEAVERRLILPGNVTFPDGHRLSALLVGVDLGDGSSELNRLTLLDGRPLTPDRPTEVVIERNLARHHGFEVGDALHLKMGKDHFDLEVRGVARSPEYLIAAADPNIFLPAKGSLGVVFAPLELLEERLGFRLVNSLLFGFAPGADRRRLEEEVARRADEKLAVEEILPRRRQFSTLFLDVDLTAFAVFVPAIVLIFTLTAMVVTQFLLFQWITHQRREIGVLMALGYGRGRLVLAYGAPVAVLAALAALTGWPLSHLTLESFGASYAQGIGLPPPHLQLYERFLAVGMAGVVIALGLASVWPEAKLLQLTPQDAVRGERARAGLALSGLLRRLVGLIDGGLTLRYALRSLLRGRGTSLMTLLSIALALGVSLSYFMAMTSFEQGLIQRLSSDRWDLSVGFLAPLWDDELGIFDEIEGVTTIDPFLRGAVRLVTEEQVRSAPVTGVDPAATLRHLEVLQGRGLVAGDRDVLVLERQAAEELGYAVGQPVTVEARSDRFEVRLVGVFSGVLPGEAYAPRETVERWLDLGEQSTGAFLRVEKVTEDLVQALFRLDRVGRVTRKSQVIDELLDITGEIMVVLYLAAGFSIAVAALFVFSVASFVVLGRRGEYAMLRILGLSDRAVGRMILTEIFFLGLFGAALAVPMGYGLAWFLTGRMSEAWFTVEVITRWRDIAVVLVPAVLVLPLAALPAIRTVLRSSLTKSLRERMFG